MSRDETRRSGISIKTLAVASASSAVATLVVPMIWQPGTLAAAAAMPVIVALISEALNRPVEHVSRAGQHVSRAGRQVVQRSRRPGEEDRFGIYAAERRRRRTRVAIVTGLLAFAIVGVAWTVTEFAVGESVTGTARTSYFGGKDPDRPEPEATPAPADGEEERRREAPEEPEATATPTATPGATGTLAPTATPTVTGTPTPTPTPGPGAAPAPATPMPTPAAPG